MKVSITTHPSPPSYYRLQLGDAFRPLTLTLRYTAMEKLRDLLDAALKLNCDLSTTIDLFDPDAPLERVNPVLLGTALDAVQASAKVTVSPADLFPTEAK